MNINKNYRYLIGSIIIGLTSLLLIGGCSKFTQLSPKSSLAESTAFTDSAKIELVANGVYQQAAIGTYNGSSGRGYPFGAASIEQAEMRGEDMVNLASFYLITYASTYTVTSANNVNHWEQLYALINQANVLITGVESAAQSGIITSDLANKYEAEGRFLRALSHHELLIHFCRPYADGNGSEAGVPYRETASNTPSSVSEGISLGRGTVAEDYTKILADLDYAETYLPETQTDGAARATKAAAIAMKTRIKLHMQDWAGVITEGAKLGTDVSTGTFTSPIGGYALTTDPATPFTSYSDNTESIFSIANSSASNGGVNGALPAMFGPSDQGARGLVATSPNLYNASYWVSGDKRRTELQVLNSSDGLYYNYKYRDYTTRGDWAPIIRYAEVLLNVAEAYSRSGNTAQALLLLNAVRNRSVPESAYFTSAPTDLTLAILQERRIEFAGEGRRWPDIHRLSLDTKYSLGNDLGIPAKLTPTQLSNAIYGTSTILTPGRAGIAYDNYRFLWPIPSSEITSNPTLAAEQNPGY